MTFAVEAGSPLQRLKPLARRFYIRNPETVARELLGKLVVRGKGRRMLAGRIVETEAYLGVEDAAAHSAAGLTARNSVLFGPAGHAYVYFIYGMHYCLNVSCQKPGEAGCVLIRALEPVFGIDAMADNRGLDLRDAPSRSMLRQIASGPGRLAQALGITRERDNGKDVTDSDLWIGDDGFRAREIRATPRVGITKAVEHPLRFYLAGNPFVSGRLSPASGR